MIDKNKAPHYTEGLVPMHKTCKCCKKDITKNNRVPNYGGVGYQKMCKDCRNAKSLESSRKKAKILRDNPLW
tara:strand:+ start:496 stop:711 length:216 start_codon:yes stop_codon:yes gene_type:complete